MAGFRFQVTSSLAELSLLVQHLRGGLPRRAWLIIFFQNFVRNSEPEFSTSWHLSVFKYHINHISKSVSSPQRSVYLVFRTLPCLSFGAWSYLYIYIYLLFLWAYYCTWLSFVVNFHLFTLYGFPGHQVFFPLNDMSFVHLILTRMTIWIAQNMRNQWILMFFSWCLMGFDGF